MGSGSWEAMAEDMPSEGALSLAGVFLLCPCLIRPLRQNLHTAVLQKWPPAPSASSIDSHVLGLSLQLQCVHGRRSGLLRKAPCMSV